MVVQHSEGIKHVCDVISVGCVLGSLTSWLPPLAALVTIIWTTIRIFETRTIKRWMGRERRKKK